MFTCWECGREMKEKVTEFIHKYRNEKLVFKAKGLVCECGYKTVACSHMEAYDIALADTYRKKHNLLTTKDILHYRKDLLGMSQKE